MSLALLATMAFAEAAAPNYQAPNSTIGLSMGTPTFVSVRGEGWVARDVSIEIGGGLSFAGLDALVGDGEQGEPAIFDAALRWRPRALCVGCGTRVLGTFGVGVGTVVTPTVELVGPWTWAVGPDLVGTLVIWSNPTFGFHGTVRVGAGPEWQGTTLQDPELGFWAFGTLGLAF